MNIMVKDLSYLHDSVKFLLKVSIHESCFGLASTYHHLFTFTSTAVIGLCKSVYLLNQKLRCILLNYA